MADEDVCTKLIMPNGPTDGNHLIFHYFMKRIGGEIGDNGHILATLNARFTNSTLKPDCSSKEGTNKQQLTFTAHL